jgi:hypothetical protein
MTKNGREQIGDFRRTSGESRNRGVSFEGQTVAEVSMKTSLRNGSLALQSASLGARLPLLLARRDDLGHVEGLDYRLRARRGLLADCTSEIAQACEDRFIRAEGFTVREQPTFFSRMLMDEKEDAVPRRIVSYRIVSYRIVSCRRHWPHSCVNSAASSSLMLMPSATLVSIGNSIPLCRLIRVMSGSFSPA